MSDSMNDILHPHSKSDGNPAFPNAPAGWSRQDAESLASKEGLRLGDEHWEAIHSLQEYFARHDSPEVKARELSDALDERFHARGGLKHLYKLFPKGPIAQGCRLAGIEPPAGSTDTGFGSVQ